MSAWWSQAVVYQVYPRSLQDSDGDGHGDLQGIRARLPHIASLGADALWLSPIGPSPNADWGYDVADFTAVHPDLGTLDDLDALVADAHALGLRVLLDVVPCHTSIEHPWFRAHPHRYVWSDRDGPQNNWRATFGGPAWSRDETTGRWYLHSFYPEQPDLDWREPEVPAAIAEVLRFWTGRGIDGFRLDAIDRLLKDPAMRDDPPATGPPALPGHPEHVALDHIHSRDADDIGDALAVLRAAAPGAFLVGEAYLPSAELGPYLEHLDAAFAFELLHAEWTAPAVRDAIAGAAGLDVAWVLSNHDFPRLPDRVGREHTRAAALLVLTLPGPAFLFAGDEIGTADGPQPDPPRDRAGRDPHRGPVCWDAEAPHGGFSTGEPWLPVACPPGGGVAQQDRDPGSLLALYRRLIAARRSLRGSVELLPAADDVFAFRRGEHLVALNLGTRARPAPPAGTPLVHTHDRPAGPVDRLGPGEGLLAPVTR